MELSLQSVFAMLVAYGKQLQSEALIHVFPSGKFDLLSLPSIVFNLYLSVIVGFARALVFFYTWPVSKAWQLLGLPTIDLDAYLPDIWPLTWVKSVFSSQPSTKGAILKSIKAHRDDHHIAEQLHQMIVTDGAGSWPPISRFAESWPEPLRPYHDIYLQMAPMLPCAEVSGTDHEGNYRRTVQFRSRMKELLNQRIDKEAVRKILINVDVGDDSLLPRDAFNGFFGCISMSRHAYRWGTIPVVKVAQEEMYVDLPQELVIPWPFLLRRYGFTSQCGNVMANYMCNFDQKENLIYKINTGMPDVITSSEYEFAHVFIEMEKAALPIYHFLVSAIVAWDRGNIQKCQNSLNTVNAALREVLKIYYNTHTETKIAKSIWLGYLQGFQGWAAGEMVDGEYVEYHGLSGNQLPVFHVVDAFLGMDTYLAKINIIRGIPVAQRQFSTMMKMYSFREAALQSRHDGVKAEIDKMVKQLQVFRTAHRVRVRPYLEVPAPERLIMTAGKSVLESDTIHNIDDAVDFLDTMMVDRLKETV